MSDEPEEEFGPPKLGGIMDGADVSEDEFEESNSGDNPIPENGVA